MGVRQTFCLKWDNKKPTYFIYFSLAFLIILFPFFALLLMAIISICLAPYGSLLLPAVHFSGTTPGACLTVGGGRAGFWFLVICSAGSPPVMLLLIGLFFPVNCFIESFQSAQVACNFLLLWDASVCKTLFVKPLWDPPFLSAGP